jgi:hypothetical protein
MLDYYNINIRDPNIYNLTLVLCCLQNSSIYMTVPRHGTKNEISINKYCYKERNKLYKDLDKNIDVDSENIEKIIKNLYNYYTNKYKEKENVLQIYLCFGTFCGIKNDDESTIITRIS